MPDRPGLGSPAAAGFIDPRPRPHTMGTMAYQADPEDLILDAVQIRLRGDRQAPMSPADLDALARIVQRLQGGARLAIGTDKDSEPGPQEVIVRYTSLRESLLAEGDGAPTA